MAWAQSVTEVNQCSPERRGMVGVYLPGFQRQSCWWVTEKHRVLVSVYLPVFQRPVVGLR